jgi:hypothetical protein
MFSTNYLAAKGKKNGTLLVVKQQFISSVVKYMCHKMLIGIYGLV